LPNPLNIQIDTVSKDNKLASLLSNSSMMLACQKLPSSRVPIWLMRQAGRYMSSYQKIRGKAEFLELCKNPDLATEITLLPINELGVDAAIIFADILLILEPLGAKLRFAEGFGPIIDNPIRHEDDVYKLTSDSLAESLSYVFKAINQTRQALSANLPLIGFSGAPFTLAAYLIEGGKVGNLAWTKTFMYRYPQTWDFLMNLLSDACIKYLALQVKAGANILQIFDSWVGCLSPHDFENYVLPYSKRLTSTIKNLAPTIYFGTDTGNLLHLIKQTECQIIGMDWRVDLSIEWQKLNYDIAVQGNLDPIILLSDKDTIAKQTKRILSQVNNRPGYIFNLGHGILPQTPIDNVKYLVNLVHEQERIIK
jgi:uroporphyrinogen decarboxylase